MKLEVCDGNDVIFSTFEMGGDPMIQVKDDPATLAIALDCCKAGTAFLERWIANKRYIASMECS